jgi:selenoprotein W-related protein
LAVELLKNHESIIESLTLIPSDGGRYEVVVDEKLIYSKLKTGRHADPGEVMGLFRKYLEEGRK